MNHRILPQEIPKIKPANGSRIPFARDQIQLPKKKINLKWRLNIFEELNNLKMKKNIKMEMFDINKIYTA